MSKPSRIQVKAESTEVKRPAAPSGKNAPGKNGDAVDKAEAQPIPKASAPDFLTNYVSNVAAFRRTTPFIVQVTALMAQSAKETLDESFPQEDITNPSSRELYLNALESLTVQQTHDLQYLSQEIGHYYRTSRGVPSLMLAAIIAETELLYAEMAKWCFQTHPNKIKSIKRNLEMSDLDEAQTIEELRISFLDKEIDEILRKSPLEQITNFEDEKLLNVEVKKAIPNLPEFLEIFERRNIMLHAGGKVSRQYLNALKKFNYPKDKTPTLNTALHIDQKYFLSSAQILANFFTLFALRVWHKHSKASRKDCDGWLVQFVYNMIAGEKYQECLQFIEMTERLNYLFTDKVAQTKMLINKAQCLKWAGDDEKCKVLLQKENWSTHADYFVLCVKILQDQFEDAAHIVKKMGKTGDIKYEEYCSWAVFRKARENPAFREAVEAVFEQELVAVRPTKVKLRPPPKQKPEGRRASSRRSSQSNTRH